MLTNVSGTLLQAVNCHIVAENCEFSNSKNALLHLTGGSYSFLHCTLANYYPFYPERGWAYSNNETLILADVSSESGMVGDHFPVIKAEFFNTIIWGKRYISTSAIMIGNNNDIPFLFKNCLLPNKETNDTRFINCLFQVDPLFRKSDPDDRERNRFFPTFDFSLQKDSPAKDAADPDIATQIPYDLKGFPRLTDGHPDRGAYEYEEGD
jgi:hypothetical protein